MLGEKIKELMLKEKSKDSKKRIENIVVFILIIIITVIAINAIWNGEKTEENKEDDIKFETDKQLAKVSETKINEDASEADMQSKLENILSNMQGVGKVKVLITYSESSEVVAMYNENSQTSQIEEKDSGGGTRTTTQNDVQKDVIYKEENGEKMPITQKVVSPKIEGAIVIAEGANDVNVKNNIIQAMEAATRTCKS